MENYLISQPLSACALEVSSELVQLRLADYESVRTVLAGVFARIERELLPALKLFESCLFGASLPAFYRYTCVGIYLEELPPNFLRAERRFMVHYSARLDEIEEHSYVFKVRDITRFGKVADFYSRAKAEYTDSQIAALSGMVRIWQALCLYFDVIAKTHTALSKHLGPDAALKEAEKIAYAYAERALMYSEMLEASGLQFKRAATRQSLGGIKAAKAKAKENLARNSSMVLKYFETQEAERHNLASELSLYDKHKLTPRAIRKIWKQYGIDQSQTNDVLAQRYHRYKQLPPVVITV